MSEEPQPQVGQAAEDGFVRQMMRRRSTLGLSQTELAERIIARGGSMFQQTIAKIESGQRAVKIAEAALIASALETNISKMLEADERERDEPTAERFTIEEMKRLHEDAIRRTSELNNHLAQAQDQVERADRRVRQITYERTMAAEEYNRLLLAVRHSQQEENALRNLIKEHTEGTVYRLRRRRPGWIAVPPESNEEEDE